MSIETEHNHIVRDHADEDHEDVDQVEVDCLQDELESDKVNDACEGDRGDEPMIRRSTSPVERTSERARHPVNNSALVECLNDPFPEDKNGEVFSFLSNFKELGMCHIYSWIMSVILKCKCKEAGERSPESVVKSRQPFRKEDLPTEPIVEHKVELSEHKDDVLVEVITYCPRDSSVVDSSMDEDELLQELELRNRVVCCSHSLASFLPSDPYPNVGFHDHRHVIRTIPNSNRDPGASILL
jgi:hypothetical protein